jgi:hypothetical protein
MFKYMNYMALDQHRIYDDFFLDPTLQKHIFHYMKQIVEAKQFYALHPKQAIICGT